MPHAFRVPRPIEHLLQQRQRVSHTGPDLPQPWACIELARVVAPLQHEGHTLLKHRLPTGCRGQGGLHQKRRATIAHLLHCHLHHALLQAVPGGVLAQQLLQAEHSIEQPPHIQRPHCDQLARVDIATLLPMQGLRSRSRPRVETRGVRGQGVHEVHMHTKIHASSRRPHGIDVHCGGHALPRLQQTSSHLVAHFNRREDGTGGTGGGPTQKQQRWWSSFVTVPPSRAPFLS